jgi:hypothetical protein
MTLLKKWWPSIIAGVVALWGTFGGQIVTLVATHPKLSSVLASVAVIIAHLVPSPVAAPPATLGVVK